MLKSKRGKRKEEEEEKKRWRHCRTRLPLLCVCYFKKTPRRTANGRGNTDASEAGVPKVCPGDRVRTSKGFQSALNMELGWKVVCFLLGKRKMYLCFLFFFTELQVQMWFSPCLSSGLVLDK